MVLLLCPSDLQLDNFASLFALVKMTRSVEEGVRVKNEFHVEGIHQSVSGGTSCGHSSEEGLLPRLSDADSSGHSADNEVEKLAWTSSLSGAVFMRKMNGFSLSLRLIIIDK
jgi:hypothetical protein